MTPCFDSGMQKTVFALFNITLMCLARMKLVSLAYEWSARCVWIRGQACSGEQGKGLGVCLERLMPDIEM